MISFSSLFLSPISSFSPLPRLVSSLGSRLALARSRTLFSSLHSSSNSLHFRPYSLASSKVSPFSLNNSIFLSPSSSSFFRSFSSRSFKRRAEESRKFWDEVRSNQAKFDELRSDSQNNSLSNSKEEIVDARLESTAELIDRHAGLRNYLSKVMNFTNLTVIGSLGAAWIFAPFASPALSIAGFIGSLSSIACFYLVKPKWVESPTQKEFYETENPPMRKFLFGTFVASNSLALAMPIAMATAINPILVPVSIALAGGTMGMATKFALIKSSGELLSWQAPFLAGALSMIGMSLTGFLAHLALGPNLFSTIAFSLETYAGLGLFTVWTAFDVHRTIAEYQQKNADHLGAVMGFYLNFVNLFVRFLQVLSKISPNSK